MTFLRKIGNVWYVFRKTHHGKTTTKQIGDYPLPSEREWYLIKQGDYNGYIDISRIIFPKEFIGKRIRLRIEELK